MSLNEARIAKDLTLKELGEIIDFSVSTVANLCSGRQVLSLKQASLIAQKLDLRISIQDDQFVFFEKFKLPSDQNISISYLKDYLPQVLVNLKALDPDMTITLSSHNPELSQLLHEIQEQSDLELDPPC